MKFISKSKLTQFIHFDDVPSNHFVRRGRKLIKKKWRSNNYGEPSHLTFHSSRGKKISSQHRRQLSSSLELLGSTTFKHSSANSMNSGSNIACFIAIHAFGAASTFLMKSRRCLFLSKSFNASLLAEMSWQCNEAFSDSSFPHSILLSCANLSGWTVSSVVNCRIFCDDWSTWSSFTSSSSLGGGTQSLWLLWFLKQSNEQLEINNEKKW